MIWLHTIGQSWEAAKPNWEKEPELGGVLSEKLDWKNFHTKVFKIKRKHHQKKDLSSSDYKMNLQQQQQLTENLQSREEGGSFEVLNSFCSLILWKWWSLTKM